MNTRKLWPVGLASTAALALTIVYGTSQASGNTATEAKSSGRAGLTSYELAPGLLDITRKPGNPTQVHGVLGMPKGKGPHPVVVVMHGNHHNCAFSDRPPYYPRKPVKDQWPLVCHKPGDPHNPNLGPDYLRHDVGLSHVVEALTRKGFAAVSIDVVSPEHWWVGEPDTQKGYTDLLTTHLRLLSDLNKGIDHGLNIPGVKGRIDTSRVGLVGHSRGGGYVLSQKAARRAGLFGVVALEPAMEAGKVKHKVPVLNVRGGCDEDVDPSAGLRDMKELARSGSTKVAADVLLAGTGHRMLNTNLPPTDTEEGDVGECPASKVAEPAAARAQAAQLTASFLDQALRGATSYRLPALKGLAPKGGNLRRSGPAVTFHKTPRQAFTSPRAIPEVTSKQRLLPAIPKDIEVNKRPGDDI
ncbi:dienelactone hydrolase family protein [Streptomyces sp. NPDC001922]|uniref:dienelactone hydrolase family protein n=1 Tax=Streptomyces sp. NPDC001922 TaxID=3364624 RepID=UPI003679C10F